MPTVIGLDLGKHTFRAVELDKSKKGLFVTNLGVYDNPKLNISDESKDSQNEYANAIKQFIKDTGFSTSKVIISLEEKDVFMRLIKVPIMNDKELKSSIMFEAEQYIPLPLEEVNLSYQKLSLPSDPKGKVSVQLVAAKKTMLDRYISMIKAAKLTPIGIEPEALSIGRALTRDGGGESATLILHLGFEKSLIIIAFKGHVVFTRTISVGGDAMTRSLEQNLDLDYIQAEEYKKAYGLNKDQAEGKIYEVLRPMIGNVIGEVGRAQVFFTTHHPNVNISRVVLSGGSALMPGLLFHMTSNLDLEVELANPFSSITFSKKIESKKDWHVEQGPLFSTPVGLALKET